MSGCRPLPRRTRCGGPATSRMHSSGAEVSATIVTGSSAGLRELDREGSSASGRSHLIYRARRSPMCATRATAQCGKTLDSGIRRQRVLMCGRRGQGGRQSGCASAAHKFHTADGRVWGLGRRPLVIRAHIWSDVGLHVRSHGPVGRVKMFQRRPWRKTRIRLRCR